MTYKTIRFYFNDTHPNEVLDTGLTRLEAQAHCADPDTSSRTCYTAAALERTLKYGPWFDGFEEE